MVPPPLLIPQFLFHNTLLFISMFLSSKRLARLPCQPACAKPFWKFLRATRSPECLEPGPCPGANLGLRLASLTWLDVRMGDERQTVALVPFLTHPPTPGASRQLSEGSHPTKGEPWGVGR